MKQKRTRFSALLILFLVLFLSASLVLPAYTAMAEDGLTAGTPARVAGTDGDGVRLRESPSATAQSLQIVDENELVTIKGSPVKDAKGNSFYKVDYNGKAGYVMTQYLVFAGKANKGVKSLPVGQPAKITNTDGDGVNMRQQPSAGTAVLALLTEGAVITVLGGPFTDKQSNSFYRVDYKGQTGYVSIAFVASAPKNTVTSGGGGYMKVTNTDGDPVRFRTGPARSFDPNGFVYEGQVVKLLGGAVKDDGGNKWYRVDRAGDIGYVDASFLAKSEGPTASSPAPAKPAPAPAAAAPAPAPKKVPALAPPPTNGPLGQRIVTYARQFLGWRYIYAGKSPSAGGFDCSGFVYWVLTQNGLRAGSTAADDLSVGKPVPADALEPGDILIWANTYMPGPSHVGIYIGGGRFIHAETEATGVTIDSLSEDYYASRFYAARRPGV